MCSSSLSCFRPRGVDDVQAEGNVAFLHERDFVNCEVVGLGHSLVILLLLLFLQEFDQSQPVLVLKPHVEDKVGDPVDEG